MSTERCHGATASALCLYRQSWFDSRWDQSYCQLRHLLQVDISLSSIYTHHHIHKFPAIPTVSFAPFSKAEANRKNDLAITFFAFLLAEN